VRVDLSECEMVAMQCANNRLKWRHVSTFPSILKQIRYFYLSGQVEGQVGNLIRAEEQVEG